MVAGWWWGTCIRQSRSKMPPGPSSEYPFFLTAERRVVLPAFSPFAAGMDIERGFPPELGIQSFEVFAATGKRVVRIRKPAWPGVATRHARLRALLRMKVFVCRDDFSRRIP
jgi:hypothetical protein